MEWLADASALVPSTPATTRALMTSQTLTTVSSVGSWCSRRSSVPLARVVSSAMTSLCQSRQDGSVDLTSAWPLPDTGLRDDLVAAYSSDRGYHDLRHLAEVLARIDELDAAGEPFHRLPVVLAAWFHDGVYDGVAGDEARSASWADRALTG